MSAPVADRAASTRGAAPRLLALLALALGGLVTSAQDVGSGAGASAAAWARIAQITDAGERTRAAVSELSGSTVPLAGEALQIAYRLGVAEGDALRLENAVALQSALHARTQATWSAVNVALTLTRAGDYAAATSVLDEQMERTVDRQPGAVEARAELLSRSALVALGAGDERRALDQLGRAVIAGSPDAAVVLARHHLFTGNVDAARAGFRALLLERGSGEPGPGAWALRGWGLTLIHSQATSATDSGSVHDDAFEPKAR